MSLSSDRLRDSGFARDDGCHLASPKKHSKDSRPINPPRGFRGTVSGTCGSVSWAMCTDSGGHGGSRSLAVYLTDGETEAEMPHCLSWAQPDGRPWLWAEPLVAREWLPLHVETGRRKEGLATLPARQRQPEEWPGMLLPGQTQKPDLPGAWLWGL